LRIELEEVGQELRCSLAGAAGMCGRHGWGIVA
jgi:hypothetical protein